MVFGYRTNRKTGMGIMDALIEKQNIIKVHQLIENQLIDDEFVFF